MTVQSQQLRRHRRREVALGLLLPLAKPAQGERRRLPVADLNIVS